MTLFLLCIWAGANTKDTLSGKAVRCTFVPSKNDASTASTAATSAGVGAGTTATTGTDIGGKGDSEWNDSERESKRDGFIAQVDIILLLGHGGINMDRFIARHTRGIVTAILGGHSHDLVELLVAALIFVFIFLFWFLF